MVHFYSLWDEDIFPSMLAAYLKLNSHLNFMKDVVENTIFFSVSKRTGIIKINNY